MKISKPAGALLGAGMVALSAVSAVKVAGGRLRHRTNPLLDELSSGDGEFQYHHLATADGGEIHVAETGKGRPMLLLHGVTLQWWVWSSLIGILSDRYRVLAWDMRGHGESRAGRDGVSLDAIADDLAMVIDELDLHDAIVVGHSMGGMALGHFAGRHADLLGERVSALGFVATSGSVVGKVRDLAGLGSLRSLYGAAGFLLRIGLQSKGPKYQFPNNDLSAVLIAAAFGPSATAEMIEDVRQMSAAISPSTSVEAGNALATFDALSVLATVRIPTTVVVGDTDRLTPPGHGRRISEAIPGATFRILLGIGHQVMQEAPFELAEELDALAARSEAERPIILR